MYKKLGGDGFYGACVCPHLEPSIMKYLKKSKYTHKIHTPNAELIQKQIMQFKTNYRDLNEAKEKAMILRLLITKIDLEYG